MTTSLKVLKYIDQRTKFVVFGYIREYENKLSLYINISPGICYICLAYYFLGEYFEKAGNQFIISNDKMTVTKKQESYKYEYSNWNNTAYGKLWINSTIPQIIKWKFKINELGCLSGICFCLVSKDNRCNENCMSRDSKKDYPNYGFCNKLLTIINDDEAIEEKSDDAEKFEKNDIVLMIFNTIKREFYCQNADQINLITIKNIKIGDNIRYKMAIQMYDSFNSVQLIYFNKQLCKE